MKKLNQGEKKFFGHYFNKSIGTIKETLIPVFSTLEEVKEIDLDKIIFEDNKNENNLKRNEVFEELVNDASDLKEKAKEYTRKKSEKTKQRLEKREKVVNTELEEARKYFEPRIKEQKTKSRGI